MQVKSGQYYFYILGFIPIFTYIISKLFNIEGLITVRIITIVYFLYYFLNSNVPIIYPKYINYLLIYILYLLIWDIYNHYYGLSKEIEFIRKPHIETILALLLVENIKINGKHIDVLMKIIKYTIIISFIVSLIQIFVSPKFFIPESLNTWVETDMYNSRRPSIFAYYGSNMIGLAFIPLVSLFFGKIIIESKGNQYKNSLFILMVGVIAFATNARYLMLSYIIILLQFSFVNSSNYIKRILLMVFIVAISLLIGYFTFTYFFNFEINTYIEERLFPEEEISKSTRYLAFVIFQEYFADNWLFGTGVHLTDEIKNALEGYSSQIHVGYLSHLVSYGIIGSFFLFMFWFKIAKKFYVTAKRSKYYGAFFGFLIFLFANVTLVYYPIFNYGLIYCFVVNKYFEQINRGSLINTNYD